MMRRPENQAVRVHENDATVNVAREKEAQKLVETILIIVGIPSNRGSQVYYYYHYIAVA